MDVTPDLPQIRCPALVMTTEGHRGGLGATAWYAKIPDCEFQVLKGDSRHPVVTHADATAQAVLDFIERATSRT
jgi:hypothetical protein